MKKHLVFLFCFTCFFLAWNPTASAQQSTANWLTLTPSNGEGFVYVFKEGQRVFYYLKCDDKRHFGKVEKINETTISLSERGVVKTIPLDEMGIIGHRWLAHTLGRVGGGLGIAAGAITTSLGAAMVISLKDWESPENSTGWVDDFFHAMRPALVVYAGYAIAGFGAGSMVVGSIPFLIPRRKLRLSEYQWEVSPQPENARWIDGIFRKKVSQD